MNEVTWDELLNYEEKPMTKLSKGRKFSVVECNGQYVLSFAIGRSVIFETILNESDYKKFRVAFEMPTESELEEMAPLSQSETMSAIVAETEKLKSLLGEE